MCVYIFGDDLYFNSGLEAYLSKKNISNKIINPEEALVDSQLGLITGNDIVVIDIDVKRAAYNSKILKSYTRTGAMVVPVIDIPTAIFYTGIASPFFISKKTPLKYFTLYLYNVAAEISRRSYMLTPGETRTIQELLSGKSTKEVSRKIKLSTKTLSVQKNSANRKIRVNGSNDISLLYHNVIFNLEPIYYNKPNEITQNL